LIAKQGKNMPRFDDRRKELAQEVEITLERLLPGSNTLN